MKEIEVEILAAAGPEEIWAVLADVSSWPQWASFDEASIEAGHGLGEIRRFRRGRWVTRERVTDFDPERRLAYELLSGIPLRRYMGEVTLTSTRCGTNVRWHSTFEPKWPGTGSLIRRGLQAFIEETAKGLAREADARSAKRDRELEEATR